MLIGLDIRRGGGFKMHVLSTTAKRFRLFIGTSSRNMEDLESISKACNDTTVDAFDSFVCKNGAGNHILGAVFVDLETIVIYEIYRDLLAAFQS
ncbi:hypothetical protein YC2023_091527 [Brassica napus]